MTIRVLKQRNIKSGRRDSLFCRQTIIMLAILFIGFHLGKMCSTFKDIVGENQSEEKQPNTSTHKGIPIIFNKKSLKEAIANPNATERIAFFKEIAMTIDPIPDKIGFAEGTTDQHRYHNMYGTFLLPVAASKPKFKFLEIGLGCNMNYGPGSSVKLWKALFPEVDLWEAESDAKCVEKSTREGSLEGINVLVGDQADYNVLDSWINKSGGKFDVIIDDGGHSNCQISNSFDKLWPQLNPGGLYFIEDLHVSRMRGPGKECGDVIMGEKMDDWQQALIYETTIKSSKIRLKYPIPEGLIMVTCQAEACVLAKRHSNINDPRPYNGR